jgi:hypothetical protein
MAGIGIRLTTAAPTPGIVVIPLPRGGLPAREEATGAFGPTLAEAWAGRCAMGRTPSSMPWAM